MQTFLMQRELFLGGTHKFLRGNTQFIWGHLQLFFRCHHLHHVPLGAPCKLNAILLYYGFLNLNKKDIFILSTGTWGYTLQF